MPGQVRLFVSDATTSVSYPETEPRDEFGMSMLHCVVGTHPTMGTEDYHTHRHRSISRADSGLVTGSQSSESPASSRTFPSTTSGI